MRLLTDAAARTVAPTLHEILSLACNLMTVLVNSRILGRLKRLNQGIDKLIEALLEKRYGEPTGEIYSPMAQVRRTREFLRQMEAEEIARGERPERQPGARPAPQTPEEKDAAAGSQAGSKPPQPEPLPATGPDLPESLEDFRALFRRALCAPSAEPENEAVGALIDSLALSLWDHLHLFQYEMEGQGQKLDQVLNEMAETLPGNSRDSVRRRCRIAAVLNAAVGEELLTAYAQSFRRRLGRLMEKRYGPDPEIDRFCQGTEGLSDCRIDGLKD